MKRKFTLLIAALALLTMIVQPGRVWGQTTHTIGWGTASGDPGTYTNFTTTSGSVNGILSFTTAKNSSSSNPAYNANNSELRLYYNSGGNGGSITIEPVQGLTITSAVMTTSTAPSVKYYVDGGEGVSISASNNTYTITGISASESLEIQNANTTNTQLRILTIEITYTTGGGTLNPCDLALADAPVELTFDLYNNSDPQEIHYTTSSTGAVTVANSDYITVAVDEDNKTITVIPEAVTNGAKTIIVNQEADDNYYAGSATFTVNITDSTPFTGDVIFNATQDMGTSPLVKNGVTFACTNGVLNNGSEYRLYKNSVTTFSVETASGNKITSIIFTGVSGNPASGFANQTGWTTDGNNGTWTGNATSVSFTASGAQVRATEIVVTVEAPSSVTAPTFSPESGTMFETSLDVTITPADGTTLYYTTDGTNPDNTGTGYTSAQIINLTETTTVKAIAYNGEEHSNVVSATYTKIAYDNIEDITEVGTAYSVKGTVVAVNSRGFIIGDGTGYVYYYNGSAPSQAVEDMVTISGTTGTYGQIIQFTNSASINEATSSNYDGTPAVSVITEVPDYSTGYHLSTYLQYEGTLSKSQDTYNNDIYLITVGETPIQISYPTDTQTTALENLIGSTVRVKGYFSGKNSSGYFTTMLESVEEIVVPTISANNIVLAYDDEEGTIEYTIVNAIVGGSLTAETEAEWIILDAPDNGVIPFICDANTGAERIATVTLTYTYNTNQTVTKNVTVSQAAAPVPSIEVTPTMISDIAYDGAEGTLIVTATLVEDLDVAFYESDGTTPAEYDWITAEINGDNNVYYIVLENETEDARTAYMKVYGMDAETNLVYSDLITFSQKAYEVDYATLPFAFDGGRSDIENTDGLYQEGLGTDYSASPKLKFDGTGDWIILKINEVPGKLTFDIKNNSFSGGTFTVQTSEDGVTYTDLENYTTITGTQSEEFDNLNENVRYIKWIYTEKASGNVGLGNIKLAKPDNTPSITLNSYSVDAPCTETDGSITVTYKNLTSFSADIEFYDDNNEPVDENYYDWLTASINSDNDVEYIIEANDGGARTAYFKVYAYYDNSKEYVYSDLVTVIQAAYTPPVVTENYALFTGDLEEGDYVIYYNGYAMKNTVTSGRLDNVAVDPENYVIATDDATIIWHIAQSGEYWTIYSANANAYAASTGVKNKAQMLEDGTDDKALWTVTGTETFEFVNKANAAANVNANLRNNGTSGWACYSTQTGGALSLYKKAYDIPAVSGGELTDNATIPAGEISVYDNLTIPAEGTNVLTITGTLIVTSSFNNSVADHLIVKDGAQLILPTSSAKASVYATVEKDIVAASEWGENTTATNWYTISSPLVGSLTTASINGLVTITGDDDYDLFSYDEAENYWRNYKVHSFDIEPGRGYLYASKNGTTVSYAGVINDATVTTSVTSDNNRINLIGNPFTQNINVQDNVNVTISGGYVLQNNGNWKSDVELTVAPCQGFLVQVPVETSSLSISRTPYSKSRANRDYIALTVANSEYEDVTYALFSDGMGLSKINHRNADIPMLYIPQNDKNYAIATMDDNTQAFNLNFKAMTTGQYTLSFKAQGSYSYLHVIDRITGEDIDMLLDGEYTFIGSPRDNENRFIVKLNYNANIDELEAGDSFAYQYGNDIIVNGKGELQVFDVNGRMVMNTVINGKQTVNVPTTGLYIFRMIGESVKTQKIVVR